MKARGRLRVLIHTSLTSALYGGEQSASRPGCFIPRKKSPPDYWIGLRVGSKINLEVLI